MLSHANAFTFLDWCDEALGPRADDRFSSHAPFHFDLSVFDLFVSCRHAATLVLIGESLGKDPARLGDFLAERRISVWYSAPSILALLTAVRRPRPRRGRRARGSSSSPARSSRSRPLRRLRALWPDAGALEPLRADRDERLHRLSGPRRPSPTTAPTPSRSARPARRSSAAWWTSRGTTCPPAPSASWSSPAPA